MQIVLCDEHNTAVDAGVDWSYDDVGDEVLIGDQLGDLPEMIIERIEARWGVATGPHGSKALRLAVHGHRRTGEADTEHLELMIINRGIAEALVRVLEGDLRHGHFWD